MIVEGTFQMGVKSILEHVCFGFGLTVERDCHGKVHTKASLPLKDTLKSHIPGGKAHFRARLPGRRLTIEPDFRMGMTNFRIRLP
jgi:hypothetical protein